MSASMTGAGFALDYVSTGEEAIGVLRSEPYNLVILDLGLPDMDGLEVLSRLRRNEIQTPILILTARDAISDRIEGLDRGADDYLAKPFHPRELESRSEEHTSELQSLMRISYAVFCLKKKINKQPQKKHR